MYKRYAYIFLQKNTPLRHNLSIPTCVMDNKMKREAG